MMVSNEKVSLVGANHEILGGMGYAERWDFSRSNKDEESRIAAVTQVASVCFKSNSLGSGKLYDRLYTESLGLPSSSFEFVPILLSVSAVVKLWDEYGEMTKDVPNIIRYGRVLEDNRVLTNLRALLEDIRRVNDHAGREVLSENDSLFFNTDEADFDILYRNYLVFHTKVDIATARQFMRHRVSWQELSRRYVPAKKVPFEVYLTDDLLRQEVAIFDDDATPEEEASGVRVGAENLVTLCLKMYDAAVSNGVKPQDARRIIPVGAMTEIWSAWHKDSFDSMIALRDSSKAQGEIRQLARAMKTLEQSH